MSDPLKGGRILRLMRPRQDGGVDDFLVTSPRCVVDFFSLKGQFRTEATLQQQDPGIPDGFGMTRFQRQPSSGIIACQTTKMLAAPAGTFTVVLHDRPIDTWYPRQSLPLREGDFFLSDRRWRDVLNKGDLAIIRMQRPPDPMEVVMVGILDRKPGWSITATPRGIERSVTITGQDLGALLLNTSIWYANEIPGADPIMQRDKAIALFGPEFKVPEGSRAKRIKNVLENGLYKLAKQRYQGYKGDPSGVSVTTKDLLGYILGKTKHIAYESSYLTTDGPFWNFIKMMCDEPWHELFVDTFKIANSLRYVVDPDVIDGSITWSTPDPIDSAQEFGNFIVMRETPFDDAPWQNLPIYQFSEDGIQTLNLQGSSELFNLFYAQPREVAYQGLANDQEHPVWRWHTDSSEIYGLQKLIRQFLGFRDAEQKQPILDMVLERTLQLERWFKDNHLYQSGSVTFQGHPAPRVGCRARHLDGDKRWWEFYLEGVVQDFRTFETYYTTLHLTRGREIREGAV